MVEYLLGDITIQVVEGDLTRQPDLDAIVNAANSSLRGGGGVDGAIHRAAGPELKKESADLAPIGPGEAVITAAYRLPNRHVIHCVGPVYGKDQPSAELLASCYHEALQLAEEKGLESIGFPAISTGVYGYPMHEAAEVMFSTLLEQAPRLKSLRLIRIVLFGSRAYDIHIQVFNKMSRSR